MDKSPEAFRTISEVAEALETPAHVLRFWETRFPQIRPVKRAGGRRYYRPADVALLTGIKRLLHDEGLTIRGVQKLLREQGVRHVADLGGVGDYPHEDEVDAELIAAMAAHPDEDDPTPLPGFLAVESAQVVALETALSRGERQLPTGLASPLPDRALSDRALPPRLARHPTPDTLPANGRAVGFGDLARCITALPRPLPDALRQALAVQSARLEAVRDQMEVRLADAT